MITIKITLLKIKMLYLKNSATPKQRLQNQANHQPWKNYADPANMIITEKSKKTKSSAENYQTLWNSNALKHIDYSSFSTKNEDGEKIISHTPKPSSKKKKQVDP